MPKFVVISPTHILRKKKEAWENFKNGGYIAIGSRIKEDLSDKPRDEILKIVRTIPYGASQLTKRLKEYPDFLSLNRGDYVAVKNGNDGLCGIGVITGDYYFKLNGHNTCSSSPDDFYSHFFPVKWLITTYMRRKNLLRPGEKSWPYGIISLLPDIPVYARRVLAKHEIKLNG